MNSNEIGVAAPGTRTNTNYHAATALYVVVSVIVFIVTMATNNCPMNNLGFQGDCRGSCRGFGPSGSCRGCVDKSFFCV
jgi:hypothetical protein